MSEKNLLFDAFDINSYSFQNICDLFGIDDIHCMTDQQLLLCKKKVVQLHPDKNPKLPKEVFLFYKKGFDRLVEIFKSINRETRDSADAGTYSHAANTKLPELIEAEELHAFNVKFNSLYEQEMNVGAEDRKRCKTENEWFYADNNKSPCEQLVAKSVAGIADLMETMKERNLKTSIENGDSLGMRVLNLGSVNELTSSGNYSRLHRNSQEPEEYINSEIFGKLCFEDIKRVHRDESICPLNDRDSTHFSARSNSVDELRSLRAEKKNLFLSSDENKQRIRDWEDTKVLQNRNHIESQYADRLVSEKYAIKNNRILSHFLQLENNTTS
jgi:hypothetical protein